MKKENTGDNYTKEGKYLTIHEAGKVISKYNKECEDTGNLNNKYYADCIKAVKVYFQNIKDIKKPFLNEELMEAAVKADGYAVKFIPQNKLTEKLCDLAVQQNGAALQSLPTEFRTPERCKKAIEQNPYAICFTPDDIITKELCFIAIRKNYMTLSEIPERYKTLEVYKEIGKLAKEQNRSLPQEVYEYLKKHQPEPEHIDFLGKNFKASDTDGKSNISRKM